MKRLIPTCDDADASIVKGAVHGVTAALYVVMLAYHAAAAFGHLVDAVRDAARAFKVGGSA